MIVMISVYMFFIGAVLSSFLMLVGERIPAGQPINGRSECNACGETIDWVSLMPIIGYLIRRGRCRACNAEVPVKYPVVEFAGGALFTLAYLHQGGLTPELFIVLLFISIMVTFTSSDLAHRVVPDAFLLGAFPLMLVLRIIYPLDNWLYGILGALSGFIFLWGVAWYGRKRFNQMALGGGDIKLYLIVGLFLELDLVFMSLFYASLIGIVFGKLVLRRKGEVPFVPFIFAGSMLAYFTGPFVIEWYLSLFDLI